MFPRAADQLSRGLAWQQRDMSKHYMFGSALVAHLQPFETKRLVILRKLVAAMSAEQTTQQGTFKSDHGTTKVQTAPPDNISATHRGPSENIYPIIQGGANRNFHEVGGGVGLDTNVGSGSKAYVEGTVSHARTWNSDGGSRATVTTEAGIKNKDSHLFAKYTQNNRAPAHNKVEIGFKWSFGGGR